MSRKCNELMYVLEVYDEPIVNVNGFVETRASALETWLGCIKFE